MGTYDTYDSSFLTRSGVVNGPVSFGNLAGAGTGKTVPFAFFDLLSQVNIGEAAPAAVTTRVLLQGTDLVEAARKLQPGDCVLLLNAVAYMAGSADCVRLTSPEQFKSQNKQGESFGLSKEDFLKAKDYFRNN